MVLLLFVILSVLNVVAVEEDYYKVRASRVVVGDGGVSAVQHVDTLQASRRT